MRTALATALVVVSVPALSALPVVGPPAATAHPVPPVVWSQPAAGVDGAALRSPERRAARIAAAGFTSHAAGRRWRDLGGPEVLTAPRRTREFGLVGVTWRLGTAADLTVVVRVHSQDGWGKWTPLAQAGAPGPGESSHARQGTEPLWVGAADGYQVQVDVRRGTLPEGLRVDLVDPGTSSADATMGTGTTVGGPVAGAAAVAAQPQFFRRAQWGADERLRERRPSYASTIKAVFVHHTATANSYSRTDVPRIIRGIYAYHTRSNGWSDIGYNFLVDRFGRAWVGRYDSWRGPVIGAHTGGFNTYTVGIAAIGDFGASGAPAAMVRRIANLTAWRLDRYHRKPSGLTRLTSTGSGTSRYPAGKRVTMRVVSGHRDAGFTECPGANLYALLPRIRHRAKDRMGAAVVNPHVRVGDGRRIHVHGYRLRTGHTWRVVVRSVAPDKRVARKTRSPRGRLIDATVQVPRSGRYVVMVRSWGDGRKAREYARVVRV